MFNPHKAHSLNIHVYYKVTELFRIIQNLFYEIAILRLLLWLVSANIMFLFL